MIVKTYADLVEQQLRALTQEDATAWSVPMVPVKYRGDVVAEIEKRKAA